MEQCSFSRNKVSPSIICSWMLSIHTSINCSFFANLSKKMRSCVKCWVIYLRERSCTCGGCVHTVEYHGAISLQRVIGIYICEHKFEYVKAWQSTNIFPAATASFIFHNVVLAHFKHTEFYQLLAKKIHLYCMRMEMSLLILLNKPF